MIFMLFLGSLITCILFLLKPYQKRTFAVTASVLAMSSWIFFIAVAGILFFMIPFPLSDSGYKNGRYGQKEILAVDGDQLYVISNYYDYGTMSGQSFDSAFIQTVDLRSFSSTGPKFLPGYCRRFQLRAAATDGEKMVFTFREGRIEKSPGIMVIDKGNISFPGNPFGKDSLVPGGYYDERKKEFVFTAIEEVNDTAWNIYFSHSRDFKNISPPEAYRLTVPKYTFMDNSYNYFYRQKGNLLVASGYQIDSVLLDSVNKKADFHHWLLKEGAYFVFPGTDVENKNFMLHADLGRDGEAPVFYSAEGGIMMRDTILPTGFTYHPDSGYIVHYHDYLSLDHTRKDFYPSVVYRAGNGLDAVNEIPGWVIRGTDSVFQVKRIGYPGRKFEIKETGGKRDLKFAISSVMFDEVKNFIVKNDTLYAISEYMDELAKFDMKTGQRIDRPSFHKIICNGLDIHDSIVITFIALFFLLYIPVFVLLRMMRYLIRKNKYEGWFNFQRVMIIYFTLSIPFVYGVLHSIFWW